MTIAATSRHRPKTAKSFRTIPVPGRLLRILRDSVDSMSGRHNEGFLFLTYHGEPWGVDGLSAAMHRIIRSAWRATGDDAYRRVMARELRTAFVNLVRDLRADF